MLVLIGVCARVCVCASVCVCLLRACVAAIKNAGVCVCARQSPPSSSTSLIYLRELLCVRDRVNVYTQRWVHQSIGVGVSVCAGCFERAVFFFSLGLCVSRPSLSSNSVRARVFVVVFGRCPRACARSRFCNKFNAHLVTRGRTTPATQRARCGRDELSASAELSHHKTIRRDAMRVCVNSARNLRRKRTSGFGSLVCGGRAGTALGSSSRAASNQIIKSDKSSD